MGLYAEPPGDKTSWIKANGTPISQLEAHTLPASQLPVVWLQQGYIALGVAYSYKELQRFLAGRPDGLWYAVEKEKLRAVVPGGEKLKELR